MLVVARGNKVTKVNISTKCRFKMASIHLFWALTGLSHLSQSSLPVYQIAFISQKIFISEDKKIQRIISAPMGWGGGAIL